MAEKLAKVPLAKPGFDALGISAPVLVQMNPEGKWENCKPENIDEERFKAIVQHLANSEAVLATKSFCTQCAIEAQKDGGKSDYVPIIMMPIYPAEQCPFDMECKTKKIKESEKKSFKKAKDEGKDFSKDKDKKKLKKRTFILQRLTDFDLLSQW